MESSGARESAGRSASPEVPCWQLSSHEAFQSEDEECRNTINRYPSAYREITSDFFDGTPKSVTSPSNPSDQSYFCGLLHDEWSSERSSGATPRFHPSTWLLGLPRHQLCIETLTRAKIFDAVMDKVSMLALRWSAASSLK